MLTRCVQYSAPNDIDQALDTTDATGRLLFHMLGAIAQFETELRAERQREGVQQALARGVRFGRREVLTPAQRAELQAKRATGVSIKALMAEYQIGRATVYRYLDEPALT